MKKLSSLLEANVTVGSLNLSNVSIDANSSSDLISSALLKDINTAASNAGINVTITTAVSGHDEKTTSGNVSRHTGGNAVDISIINGSSITKKLGDKLVSELVKLGYQSVEGETPSVPKSILWQVDGHKDHVHVSNTTGAGSTTTGAGSTSSSVESDSRTKAKKILVKMIGNTFGVNESKQERILKDIEKIKNLL
jgi:hypothetical protein